MNKILKLFINENIKTWKKLSTKILIIIAILSLIGTLGLVKVIEKIENKYSGEAYELNWKDAISSEKKFLEEQLLSEDIDEITRNSYKEELEKYNLCLKYDVSPWKYYWKNDLIQEIAKLKIQNSEIEINSTYITQLLEILEKDDFGGYIDLQKQDLEEQLKNKYIAKEEYDDEVVLLELTKKYEIGKDSNDKEYWRRQLITEIRQLQTAIRTNIDVRTNKVITAENKQKYEDDILIDIYRLENQIVPLEYTTNYRSIFETLSSMFGVAAIAVITIIIAGGTISSEVSTGTIKFWALTPNKRWKILTAKILSLIFYVIVITLIISILNVVLGNIFFEEKGNPYLFVKNGEVSVIPNLVFMIEMYLAKMIPVIIFALFAIMLSVLTRNTAASISFSLAMYLGNGIIMSIINMYIKKDWIRYVPFNNLNIFEKIFVNYQSPLSMAGSSFANSTSLMFSLGVLGVCAILMLVTMYDSFNKRDII